MTPQFAAYIAPARRYPQLWRLVLGFALFLGVYFSWATGTVYLFALSGGESAVDPRTGALDRLSEPLTVLVLLSSFLGGWLGIWLAARLLQHRGWRSLFGHPPRVLADFVLGAGVMLALGGGAVLMALPLLPALEPVLPWRAWLMLLPLALAGVLIQTGAEELVFRGYLQQQLAARFASRLIWLGLPSALFGFAHFTPGDENVWLVVAATGLFGLVAADLTARSGALGLAWGLHFANNVLAILVVSAMPGLDGLALFRLAEGAGAMTPALLAADMVLLVLVWGVCALWLRRR